MSARLVPVEPTEEMIDAAGGLEADMRWVWSAMLSAAPDPTEDEALVERVARSIEPIAWAMLGLADTKAAAKLRDKSKLKALAALAAIRAMGEKP